MTSRHRLAEAETTARDTFLDLYGRSGPEVLYQRAVGRIAAYVTEARRAEADDVALAQIQGVIDAVWQIGKSRANTTAQAIVEITMRGAA